MWSIVFWSGCHNTYTIYQCQSIGVDLFASGRHRRILGTPAPPSAPILQCPSIAAMIVAPTRILLNWVLSWLPTLSIPTLIPASWARLPPLEGCLLKDWYLITFIYYYMHISSIVTDIIPYYITLSTILSYSHFCYCTPLLNIIHLGYINRVFMILWKGF